MTAPIFIFDSHEKWFPVAAEAVLDVPGVRFVHPNGTQTQLASIDELSMPGGRINFPAGMEPLDAPPVGYHRVVAGGHLWWHQWWLFSLYNPKRYAGTGDHEGDWEFVQVGCADKLGLRPILVTASQHHTGGKREAWRVVQRQGRMVFYVARDSHANYFAPLADIEDQCDGKGRVLDNVEWRDFGPWATWPGRWGNSTGEGKSPESPGCQGHRWARPELYHGQAR